MSKAMRLQAVKNKQHKPIEAKRHRRRAHLAYLRSGDEILWFDRFHNRFRIERVGIYEPADHA